MGLLASVGVRESFFCSSSTVSVVSLPELRRKWWFPCMHETTDVRFLRTEVDLTVRSSPHTVHISHSYLQPDFVTLHHYICKETLFQQTLSD